jgi:hypothetical protein
MFLLFFGLIASFASLYTMYACLSFLLNPKVLTSGYDFLMGFVLAFSALAASLALIYVSIQGPSKREFSLI